MDFKMSYLLNIIGGLIIKGSAQEKTLKFGNKLFITQNLRSTLFPVYRSGHEKEKIMDAATKYKSFIENNMVHRQFRHFHSLPIDDKSIFFFQLL